MLAADAVQLTQAMTSTLNRDGHKPATSFEMIDVAETNAIDGFKETEVGTIPAEWQVVQLGDAATISQKPRGLDLFVYEHIPFFPMEVLPTDGVFTTRYVLKSPDEISSGTYVERGDVLLSKITPSFENGKQAIVEDIPTPFAYATTEVYPLHPDSERLDRMYLFYYLKQSRVRIEIAGKMEGTTGRQRVPKAVVENYPIPLPPLPEQQGIAHVLSTIQRAMAAQKAVIAAAREVKRSLMRRLFTYGPYADPLPTRETEIGEVPEEWQVVELGQVISSTQYGLSIRADADGTYPMLRMNNLQDGRIDTADLKYIDLDSETFEKFRLNQGDVIFNRTNSYELVGKTALFDLSSEFVFASYLIRLVAVATKLDSRFLNCFLNWDATQRRLKMLATRGVSQSNVSASKLACFAIALPPLEEQQRIVLALSAVEDFIAAAERRRTALQALFKSMLHELMTGKVRVGMQRMGSG